jgi:hypothetical protein
VRPARSYLSEFFTRSGRPVGMGDPASRSRVDLPQNFIGVAPTLSSKQRKTVKMSDNESWAGDVYRPKAQRAAILSFADAIGPPQTRCG